MTSEGAPKNMKNEAMESAQREVVLARQALRARNEALDTVREARLWARVDAARRAPESGLGRWWMALAMPLAAAAILAFMFLTPETPTLREGALTMDQAVLRDGAKLKTGRTVRAESAATVAMGAQVVLQMAAGAELSITAPWEVALASGELHAQVSGAQPVEVVASDVRIQVIAGASIIVSNARGTSLRVVNGEARFFGRDEPPRRVTAGETVSTPAHDALESASLGDRETATGGLSTASIQPEALGNDDGASGPEPTAQRARTVERTRRSGDDVSGSIEEARGSISAQAEEAKSRAAAGAHQSDRERPNSREEARGSGSTHAEANSRAAARARHSDDERSGSREEARGSMAAEDTSSAELRTVRARAGLPSHEKPRDDHASASIGSALDDARADASSRGNVDAEAASRETLGGRARSARGADRAIEGERADPAIAAAASSSEVASEPSASSAGHLSPRATLERGAPSRSRERVKDAERMLPADAPRARAMAEDVLQEGPAPDVRLAAWMVIADAHRREQRPGPAAQMYRRVSSDPEVGALLEEALFRQAELWWALGRAELATAALTEASQRVPRALLGPERAALARAIARGEKK